MMTLYVHSRSCQERREQEVEIHHRIHVGVKESSLWHFPNNLPQLRSFHALLCETEHHPRICNRSSLLCEGVLELGRPDRALFLLSYTPDNLACFFGKRGERLRKAMV